MRNGTVKYQLTSLADEEDFYCPFGNPLGGDRRRVAPANNVCENK
jgi:hypothetical protein